ncbi:MAG: PIN domain-containing protein [Desulfofustis sp. PB-SRB1]|jgi:predicted nucleic acid-binding protein|nr:PIN domain-containing protein [Desulfofustis sp. PB-SRB1]MBM1002215.1 PIN domain-containing protein [Desulfofustis sp. PB-SRB1]
MPRTTFTRAAQLYRTLRKHGVTIRTPVDCLISAVAIEHECRLLHNDRDFDTIAHHSTLKMYQ